MSNAKRRVTVRRAKAGANDPIERAHQAGLKEGREAAKADYKAAEAAAVARAQADERAVRSDVMKRMEKEIEDLEERCRVLERRHQEQGDRGVRRRDGADKWSHQHEAKEWIAPFDEDVPRSDAASDPALEPGNDAPRRSTTLGR